MNEFVIAIDPPEAVALEIEAGRIVNVPSPPEVYVPYIGENGHWWVAGVDSGRPARGEAGAPGEKGERGHPGEDVPAEVLAAVQDKSAQAEKSAAAAGERAALSEKSAADAANAAAAASEGITAARQSADWAAYWAEQAREAAAQSQSAATLAAEVAAHAGGDAKAARQAAEASVAHAAQAEKSAAAAVVKAEKAADAVAAMPAVVSGRAPCAKTGSFNFTRIYFPRAFVSTPDVVPGIQDFGGTLRLVAIIGLTPEYVDLTTNYWHVGNTFSYVAIGELL